MRAYRHKEGYCFSVIMSPSLQLICWTFTVIELSTLNRTREQTSIGKKEYVYLYMGVLIRPRL